MEVLMLESREILEIARESQARGKLKDEGLQSSILHFATAYVLNRRKERKDQEMDTTD
jgi:hypothetical protein